MIEPMKQFEGLNVTFTLTEDCNLRCRYCYVLHKKLHDLPIEYAYKFIDWLLESGDPIAVKGTKDEWMLNQGLILDFIGGEPLLKPDLIDKIMQYFIYKGTLLNHRWVKNYRMSVSTNGTLFNRPEVRALLEKYQNVLSIGVSVDGVPEIHNYNRSNSMNAILKEWGYYLSLVGLGASTKATLNKEAIPYMADSVKFLHEEMGLNYIYMNFIFEDMGLEQKDYEELERQFEKIVDYVLEHRNDLYFSMFDKYMGRGQPMQDPNSSWCGSGRMPCLATNGKIYPCFRFSPINMSKPEYDFPVGDVWKGLYRTDRFKFMQSLTRKVISPEKCFSCPYETSCAWCIASAYGESGKFYRQTNICDVHKIQARWAEEYWRKYDRITGRSTPVLSFTDSGLPKPVVE